MRIGMACYASLGGSGVVATELARALADRGHEVHLISSERPFRWRDGVPRLTFHGVSIPSYPLFREPQYLLALATTIAHVAADEGLDIVHAHYAVPHATAAYLADQMLASAGRTPRPKTVTTLHGTDITLVGSDPSYAWAVAFCIERSDVVTAVSESLRRDTVRGLGIRHPVEVIPNFLDCEEYRRRTDEDLRRRYAPGGEPILLHMSNFRPVKRVDVVLDVFRQVHARRPARLLLVGDGPDRAMIERRAREADVGRDVVFVGEEYDPVRWLSIADVFLLPSAQESFGLAALEAMACEVPVIASDAGGLPEIIEDGVTGYICAQEAVEEMAARVLSLLDDSMSRVEMGRRAASFVRDRYCTARIVPLYEQAYAHALA